MKITKKVLALTGTLLFVSAVTFAKKVEVAPVSEGYEEASEKTTELQAKSDSYEEPSEQDNSTEAVDSYEEIPLTTTSSKKKSKNSIKNPFDGFFTPKQQSYKFYDTIPLSTGTMGYGIKHRTAEVFVDPKTKKVGIQVYYQSSFFDFMFDEKDVALIAEGYEKYLQDFAAHNLIKNNSMKTRKMYTNKGKCRVEWGTVKAMMNNFGDTKFHVGYEFKNKSPYFCIIVKDAKNIATDIGSNVAEKSVEVQLYFTKAEARQLLDSIGRERVKQELQDEVLVNDEY